MDDILYGAVASLYATTGALCSMVLSEARQQLMMAAWHVTRPYASAQFPLFGTVPYTRKRTACILSNINPYLRTE